MPVDVIGLSVPMWVPVIVIAIVGAVGDGASDQCPEQQRAPGNPKVITVVAAVTGVPAAVVATTMPTTSMPAATVPAATVPTTSMPAAAMPTATVPVHVGDL